MPSSNQPIRLPVRRTINTPMVAYAAPASPDAMFASPSATIMSRQPTSVRTGPASANTAVAIHRAFDPRRTRSTAMEDIIVRGAGRDQGAAPPPPAGDAPPSGLAVEPDAAGTVVRGSPVPGPDRLASVRDRDLAVVP